MKAKEYTKNKTVSVIYDYNGMHVLEKHVYQLMEGFADEKHKEPLSLLDQMAEALKDVCDHMPFNYGNELLEKYNKLK